jgi:adenosylmethionine-8-amino-7-oxononanoate aminotransferase
MFSHQQLPPTDSDRRRALADETEKGNNRLALEVVALEQHAVACEAAVAALHEVEDAEWFAYDVALARYRHRALSILVTHICQEKLVDLCRSMRGLSNDTVRDCPAL